MNIEAMVSDSPPVVSSRVHWKARCQRPIHPDDDVILAGAAAPRFDLATHEILHFVQPLDRIHHLIALALLVDDPIDKVINARPVFRPDIGAVAVIVLKMTLL